MLKLISKIKIWLVVAITAVIAIVATIVIVNVTQVRSLKAQIDKQQTVFDKEMARVVGIVEKQYELIIELAKIEKYKIENKFDGKIKATDASQIVLSLDSKLTSIPDTATVPQRNKEPPENTEKRGFFKRIFNLK